MAKTVNNVKINSAFTTAASREQLTSGENLCTSLGKINKYLVDLDAGAFSFPADGGNADTVNKKSAVDIMNMGNSVRNRTKINDGTDLDTMITGGKFYAASSISSATILHTPFPESGFYLDVFGTGAGSGITTQVAMKWSGAIKIRYYGGSTWSDWALINDGGNAATLETHPASDFLYANGFAGQLANLFANTAYDSVPDTATLNDLSPGIYRVNTSAARVSLGIPYTAASARPNTSVSEDAMRAAGGLLIKLGKVVSGPTYYKNPGGFSTYNGLLPSAFFIEANGGLYYAYCMARQYGSQAGLLTTYDWSWRALLSTAIGEQDPLNITSITYLKTDVTVAAGTSYLFYKTKPTSASNPLALILPYTRGRAYGPTDSYTLTYDADRGGLIYTAPSSGTVTLPAGQYLLALE